MKKAKWLVLGLILCVVFVGIAVCQPKTYTSAKRSSERFLARNREEMTVLAEEVFTRELTASNYLSGTYKGVSYSMYENREYVKFDIDCQGFLGGQYWSLVYYADDAKPGERESLVSGDGNNIIRSEQIDGNWWFHWIDYDGTERSYR